MIGTYSISEAIRFFFEEASKLYAPLLNLCLILLLQLN